jgi:hypothetical protein
LLRRAAETPGKQLQFDSFNLELKEVDELRELTGARFENPEEKYQAYYNGIRKVLMQYLPTGKDFKQARDIIYDEKNVFLNLGKKKSDNNGIRGSDGMKWLTLLLTGLLPVKTPLLYIMHYMS